MRNFTLIMIVALVALMSVSTFAQDAAEEARELSTKEVALKESGEKINVNTADKEQLMKLYRVGDKTSDKIIAERDANGTFKDAEDLKVRVKGIGDKTIERNADYMTF